MQKIFLISLLFFLSHSLTGQQTKRVLFIGNSYVYSNNLPLMVSKLAAAHLDTMIFDSNTPGGYTFQNHSTNATTLSKIAAGNWDYVVLQEQSQLPAFPPAQVATQCLPYAALLDSLIHAADSCAETVFFMTWGRKYGDASNCASYPPICTYEGMQERLRESYLMMGQQNLATVAPVGCAWREVRKQNLPFDLYVADESHPSVYGSYLAACIFYSAFFKKPVTSLSYTAGIPVSEAALIQQQCNQLVFDSLSLWFSNGNIPFAGFGIQQNSTAVTFNNSSLNATYYSWSFGDGTTSALQNPQHTYTSNGTFTVTLTASTDCDSSIDTDSVTITTVGINPHPVSPAVLVQYSNNELKLISDQLIYKLTIRSIDGKQIFSQSRFSSTQIQLKTGMYFITLETSDLKICIRKIVVTGDSLSGFRFEF
ncbi:MAG: PKD domain-containing protein [Bacteroidia bacterium]|nr:PKD domain-containing protein [Bacteroidia bacterium]